ncbi:MAG: putative toxin-antitoxin system toxin component, PIN family [Alphaproteobacteria bacterium]|nr:putative toxin-antitoxin system toxin component, PIN family [Alphaproteobacteria bacterium]
MTFKVVIDTNVWISGLLFDGTIPAQIVDAVLDGRLEALADDRLYLEIASTLQRKKFDRYFKLDDRMAAFDKIVPFLNFITAPIPIEICRDPNDNMILEIAVNGEVSHIITGDADLHILHPFRKIPILSPSDFVKFIS